MKKLRHFVKLVLGWVKNHKWLFFGLIILLVVGGYFAWKKLNPAQATVRYVTAQVTRGALTSSLSGTGQVLPTSQVDIKTKASGTVLTLNARNGQVVKEGDILAQMDSRSAALSISQAKTNLDQAELALKELLAPSSDITLVQAENSLLKSQEDLVKLRQSQQDDYVGTQESKQKAEDALVKAYDDGYTDIASAFLDLPSTLSGLYTILYSAGIPQGEPGVGSVSDNSGALLNSLAMVSGVDSGAFKNLLDQTQNKYREAKTEYDAAFIQYTQSSRNVSTTELAALVDRSALAVKKTADAIKSVSNVLDYWVEFRTAHSLKVFETVKTYQSSAGSYASVVNSHLAALSSVQRSIKDNVDSVHVAERNLAAMERNNPIAIAQAERSIKELAIKFADLKKGPEQLDIDAQRLVVAQRRNDLASAQVTYSDRIVRAPFAGTLTAVEISRGDTLGSGATVATILTEQKMAQITLNEVDVAKVTTGQKVLVTFDAIDDLTITGTVVEIDSLGTVSQGVVSYTVKIVFDVQDERIKPNMSLTANIILSSVPDVLTVPAAAVKADAQGNYVEVLVNNQPERRVVQVGASSDTAVEITSGVAEGESVVTQKITTSATTAAAATTNSNATRALGGFSGPGGGGIGGAQIRAQ